ncbi:ATP-binding protein [Pseudanabaena sp. BC1403]|uniref:ATP-binding protein n=1 Tax=Pseudanabaena sp. BC1403 TaxID=2043171 RepID=UPI000CD80956|nr:ATP-binding protein [Pseudanabaena sp. BC1403]
MTETPNIKFIDSEITLTNCDREPIHIPGTIQPHGILMVLSPSDFLIKQVSANTIDILGIEPKAILDSPLVDLIGIDSIAAIQASLMREFEQTNPLKLILTIKDTSPQSFNGIVHLAKSGEIVLELEPMESPTSDRTFSHFYYSFHKILAKIQWTQTLEELCTLVVKEVKQLTGCDRVMIYRFKENGDGWIVAEAKQPEMESFLGLQYPHTDIPIQARYLYTINWLRFLVDINAQPVGLVTSDPQDSEMPVKLLDMSHCVLRSISPIHIEYLKNMGVGASMSVSLIQQKHLWGLIVCHHNSAKYIPYEIRTVCEFLGHLLSSELAAKEANENLDYKLQLKTIQSKFVERLIETMDFLAASQTMPDGLLQFTGAQGAAICDGVNITLIGTTPNKSQIFGLLEWLPSRIKNDLFVTDGLSLQYPDAGVYKDSASGLLAMVISQIRNLHILWFRPEILQTVTWAGEPNKQKKIETDGSVTLTPRQSFAAWEESVRFKSTPWLPSEINGAIKLREVLQDITGRNQAEEQLKQANEELLRATRLKDEFLANMSHELRTPLNSILGMNESLQEGIFGSINQQQLKALQTIENSSNHLLALINDILDVAKIESGQVELNLTSVNIKKLCQSSLVFIKQQALTRRIQLIEKIPSRLPETMLDERRIRQVLINLLNNAVKFTPEGGTITLEVSLVKLAEYSESSVFLRISVIDTGIGISPENIQKLFKPFVQIDSALNRQYQGTGLGLTLVKRLVEIHGGHVSLTSKLDEGSCFTINLPFCSDLSVTEVLPEFDSQGESILEQSQSQQVKSPLILLAEDNEANIMTISSYLAAKECQIIVAKNGVDAIAITKSERPDLILMDIQMPVMDGLEAITQIRLDPSLVDIPIIALTALAMEGDRDRCLAAGANEYMSKPIKLKQLDILVQQLL